MQPSFIQKTRVAILHPAFLFALGNAILALNQAEPIAITINVLLAAIILVARLIETFTDQHLGIPFSVLAVGTFYTAFSVEFNHALGANGGKLFAQGLQHFDFATIGRALHLLDIHHLIGTKRAIIAGHVTTLAYISWGFGQIFAGRHEKHASVAKHPAENPQTYNGIGNMLAANAAGSLNFASFPLMVVGFIRSMLIGRSKVRSSNGTIRFLQEEATAARIYGAAYTLGAVTSLTVPNFAVAQIIWALANFQFKKDT